MALTPDPGGRPAEPSDGQPGEAEAPEDAASGAELALEASGESRLVSPIVVPNTLWTSTDPAAYDGGTGDRAHPPARVRR